MTSVDPLLLEILVCPETKQPVRLAEAELVGRLNKAQARGELLNRAGRPLAEPMEAGLVREDGAFLYPVIDGIPVMLIEEGIPLGESPS